MDFRILAAVALLSPGVSPGAAAPVPAVEVPFLFWHNQIVLDVTVEGCGNFAFLLDTGTHASAFDLGAARRLKLPLQPEPVPAVGPGRGRAAGYKVTLPGLQVGGVRVDRLPAVALNLEHISRALGRKVDGVLGHSFLAGRITQIDYFERRIRFFSESPFASEPNEDRSRRLWFRLQFRPGKVLPVLENCEVNGQPISLHVDTGASAGLVLSREAAGRLGLEELAKTGIAVSAAAYNGPAAMTKAWVRSLKLRTLDLGAVEVLFLQDGLPDASGRVRDGGNIGNALLQDFVVTLDYRNGEVVLEQIET